ncbi:hypothetical protein METHB2_730009 [Candidatus Methylobacter favarea]|uniref:Uncharacterized protein n=1 Tax=Candidatus Methylobacter favarea TaxID=2707345 RepID=A0A8S0WLE4_9GAMM|nr:hypothetical protein [Candidatus Methylobacter favarea]CAA9892570.1 hypothetical protein METHB2_730009 [Candidatus Methylobacter favarea]
MATSIRLAPEVERRFDYLAVQTGRTKAFYLREIIVGIFSLISICDKGHYHR